MNPEDSRSMDMGFDPDPRRDPAYMGPRGNPTQGGVHLSNEQFEALLARVAPQPAEYDYADAIGQTIEQQPAPVQQQYQDPLAAMLEQLPNPNLDLDGFKRGLGQVLVTGRDTILQEARANAGGVAQINRTFDDAWNDMKERYGDVAQYEDLVADASRREFEDLRSRGIDPNIAIQANMEGFVDSIAGRVQQTVNRIRGVNEEGAGPDDYARTQMIDGGSPGRRNPARDDRPDVPTSLVDDLRKVQRELNIY